MAQDYTPVGWKDHVVDGTTGEVLQQGTPVSENNLNHMDEGIALAHEKLEGASRQVKAISHGVQLINAEENAPVSIQMDGNTLISLQNTDLDAAKYYVLADKRTNIKFSDSLIVRGMSKFQGVNVKPQMLTRIATFENKIRNSFTENPHVFKVNNDRTALQLPNGVWAESVSIGYTQLSELDGNVASISSKTPGVIPQGECVFNIIEEIERELGKIPRNSTATKAQWVRENVSKIIFNIHGKASGPSSAKLYARVNNYGLSGWEGTWFNEATDISKLSAIVLDVASRIGDDGLIHFIAFSDASDGVTEAKLIIDHANCEIELKSNAPLYAPRIPLYEVTKEQYDNILVAWNEEEVLRRFPKVEGIQHIQNPYVIAVGGNVLPQPSEWNYATGLLVDANTYKRDFTTAGETAPLAQFNVIPSQQMTLSGDITADWVNASSLYLKFFDSKGVLLQSASGISTSVKSATFITPENAAFAQVYLYASGEGTFSYTNLMLNFGSEVQPFIPRNPSYLYLDTKLGSIGSSKDILFERDGKMMVNKVIEKDITLDGSLSWVLNNDFPGFKLFRVSDISVNARDNHDVVIKFNGTVLKEKYNTGDQWDSGDKSQLYSNGIHISVWDSESGFAESYSPTSEEIKAVFYGWKAKTLDGNSKPIEWVSVIDGTDAPTQTLEFVSSNKATGYNPYTLSYILDTPITLEVIQEGALSVSGPTILEVGSGIVFREKIIPYSFGSIYEVGNLTSPSSNWTKKRIGKIVAVYKNDKVDDHWFNQSANDGASYGLDRAKIRTEDFDESAEYYISYLVYDKNQFTVNPINGTATFASNIRTSLDDNIKVTEDNKREISIQALQIYNMLVRMKAGGI